MAVNKNFVVKNGLEVNDNLLVADVASQKVGIGTSVASYDLHVLGGIGATESYVSGVGTFADDLYVLGNLNVTGDVVYDEVTGRNIYITGVSTFDGIKIGDPSGIVTASTATGIVTYYGDASNLTGFAPGLSAAIGVGSESTFVGAGITEVYFATTTGQNVNVVKNGTKATVTVTPGVSLGLAIALGG